MTFEDLLARLLGEIETRIQNGSLTERGLARMTNMSQPHVHHILKRKRGMTPKVADRFLRVLGMDACELLVPSGVATVHEQEAACLLVPLLEGSAGPGFPVPRVTSSSLYFPFPAALLKGTSVSAVESLRQYAVVRAGFDELLRSFAEEHDLLIVSLLSGSTATAASPAGSGRVMLWEYQGSWQLDAIPMSALGPDDSDAAVAMEGQQHHRHDDHEKLRERRRLLHRNGKPAAVVHWLLRRMNVGMTWTRS